jgi:hypothetical protein
VNTSKLAAAIAAVEHGWHVFPLLPDRKTPGRAMTDWEARATTNRDSIARWWTRHPQHNIAIACGPSRLVVVDLDLPKPGQQIPPETWAEHTGARCGLDVLTALAQRHCQAVPLDTYTVQTTRGGLHLYFAAPADVVLRNTSSRVGWLIDTRAHGGSIVNTSPYQLRNGAAVAELPDWLHHLLSAPPPTPPSTPAAAGQPAAGGRRGYIDVAFCNEIDRAAHAPEGQRNSCLNKAAWNLSRFIAVGDLERSEVERALQHAGEQAASAAPDGQSPREIAASIRSAINAGLVRHPRIAS